jgi:hypothetical protein
MKMWKLTPFHTLIIPHSIKMPKGVTNALNKLPPALRDAAKDAAKDAIKDLKASLVSGGWEYNPVCKL